jgi:hypothetical protein
MTDEKKLDIKLLLEVSNFEIPKNDEDIIKLYFVSIIIENINYSINWYYDFIDNPKPSEPYASIDDFAKEDMAFRSALSQFNKTTKEQLKKLIKESIEGIMSNFLFEIDRDLVGNWKISLENETGKNIGNLNIKHLYAELYYWIDLFNKNKKE